MSAAPSVDLVIAHVVLLRLGAVVVPANTAYLAREIDHIRSTTRPVLAIMDRRDRVADLPCADVDPARATLFFGVPTMFARLAESG